jgi:hypothetical protein
VVEQVKREEGFLAKVTKADLFGKLPEVDVDRLSDSDIAVELDVTDSDDERVRDANQKRVHQCPSKAAFFQQPCPAMCCSRARRACSDLPRSSSTIRLCRSYSACGEVPIL